MGHKVEHFVQFFLHNLKNKTRQILYKKVAQWSGGALKSGRSSPSHRRLRPRERGRVERGERERKKAPTGSESGSVVDVLASLRWRFHVNFGFFINLFSPEEEKKRNRNLVLCVCVCVCRVHHFLFFTIFSFYHFDLIRASNIWWIFSRVFLKKKSFHGEKISPVWRRCGIVLLPASFFVVVVEEGNISVRFRSVKFICFIFKPMEANKKNQQLTLQ